jgi:peptidoglycan-associated lipoprotein
MTHRSSKTLFAPATALAFLAACGGSTPPAASAATPSAAGPPTASTMETPTQAATSGSIQIAREILAACGIPGSDAFFPFDSSRLENKDLKVLNDVAVCFTVGPMKGRSMKLIGHADPRGATGYNMTLGQARADAVQKYLADKGVAPTKAQGTSRGAMDATGTDEVGWAHDRRVDVTLAS